MDVVVGPPLVLLVPDRYFDCRGVFTHEDRAGQCVLDLTRLGIRMGCIRVLDLLSESLFDGVYFPDGP